MSFELSKTCSLVFRVQAVGARSVSVFGPVSEKVYGPFPPSAKHIVLKWDMVCRPCYKNFRMPVCENDRECLRQVSVGAVFDAAARLLGE